MKTIIRNSAITVFLTASFTLNGMNNANNQNNDQAYITAAVQVLELLKLEAQDNLSNIQRFSQIKNEINHPLITRMQQGALLLEENHQKVLTSIENTQKALTNPNLSNEARNTIVTESKKVTKEMEDSIQSVQIDFQKILLSMVIQMASNIPKNEQKK